MHSGTPNTSKTREKVNQYDVLKVGARCSSVERAFAHGAIGRQIDPSWGEPIELFLVPASRSEM